MSLHLLLDSRNALMFPMAALGLWTTSVVVYLGVSRYRAVSQRRVNPKYYQLYVGADGEPLDIAQISQHVENLFEAPPLFYAASIALFAMGDRSSASVLVAWAYVAARLVHSIVSLGKNDVMARFVSFASSMALIGTLWVRVALHAAATA